MKKGLFGNLNIKNVSNTVVNIFKSVPKNENINNTFNDIKNLGNNTKEMLIKSGQEVLKKEGEAMVGKMTENLNQIKTNINADINTRVENITGQKFDINGSIEDQAKQMTTNFINNNEYVQKGKQELQNVYGLTNEINDTANKMTQNLLIQKEANNNVENIEQKVNTPQVNVAQSQTNNVIVSSTSSNNRTSCYIAITIFVMTAALTAFILVFK